eukprot:CAMPEP_0119493068 /NCGR_PEP_ID=MMETSP1344-20130328/17426_1 /TAXON_ID=236787 /ORGANISM="Florenciella parvula, Strain CCMP2471" /LENGTH=60 /DNA_ID=CAMNT_0007528457 /DNA_START=186 /DNA_END=364 /DNA_ORIENTATION=+
MARSEASTPSPVVPWTLAPLSCRSLSSSGTGGALATIALTCALHMSFMISYAAFTVSKVT